MGNQKGQALKLSKICENVSRKVDSLGKLVAPFQLKVDMAPNQEISGMKNIKYN